VLAATIQASNERRTTSDDGGWRLAGGLVDWMKISADDERNDGTALLWKQQATP